MTTRHVAKLGHVFEVVEHYDPARTGDPNNVDYWSLFERGVWEPETFEVLAEFLHGGVTFLDVGAWVGPITMVAAKLASHVVAIEPDPVALADLLTHVALNDLTNVRVHDVAVGPPGVTSLGLGRKEGGALGDSMTSWQYDLDVIHRPALALEALVPDGCGLIKVDIEGFECEALAEFDLPCPMWLSTHPSLMAEPDTYWRKLDRFLARHKVTRRVGDDLLVLPGS